MRFQLLGPWPVNQFCIPAGTIIEINGTDQWSLLVKGLRPPLNSMPLDKYTWEWLQKLYPGETHQIVTPPGRNAKATGRSDETLVEQAQTRHPPTNELTDLHALALVQLLFHLNSLAGAACRRRVILDGARVGLGRDNHLLLAQLRRCTLSRSGSEGLLPKPTSEPLVRSAKKRTRTD